ncbi:hypothetical protein WME88_35630 [Sorangium sp. So ce216]
MGELHMSNVMSAVNWALTRYNEAQSFRQTTVEIGNVLYADRTSGSLKPGSDVLGPDAGEVRPYTARDLERILEHMAGVGDVFWGDYHCHVATGLSWTDHVPSPADIVRQSCLCDLWELEAVVEVEGVSIDCISVFSEFQLMQANLFGDVFVIVREPSRVRFSALAEQKLLMQNIGAAYAKWHLVAHHKYGELEFPLRHGDFVAQVNDELVNMNATLGGRARIEFIENKSYKSDDDDFLE